VTIQWFTVVAQILNFLVLVFLLQRFLYKPIVNAMDARQETIARRMRQAAEKEQQAEEEAATYRQKQNELDEKQDELMAEMRREVDERRETLLQQAHDDVAARQRQWRRALQRERDEFLQELRRQTSRDVYRLAERALADVADASLNAQAVRAFLRHLQDLEQDRETAAWQELQQALRQAKQPVVVQSAFDLSDELRQQIEETLQTYTEHTLELRFETDPDLIAGVTLQAPDHLAAWHLDAYLETMAARTQDMLEAAAYEETEGEGEAETQNETETETQTDTPNRDNHESNAQSQAA